MARIPTRIGDGAGVLAVSLTLMSLGAALWVLGYPTIEVTVTATKTLKADPGSADQGFRAFAYFCGYTTVIGVIIGAWTARTRPLGPLMLAWVVLCSAAGAAWSLWLGQVLVGRFFGFDATSISPGDTISVAPSVDPSVALLCAPAAAATIYWAASAMASASSVR
ncbi:MAG TPA: hypothetical protein H9867_03395 [Candidatus Corynebacterium gallistercoris]|uniref:DUF2567 domain-containing protein n=1 Tax=Candidatus Corynebacterium gallistercoris TaxID=2838530 RepID=A0A9D1RZF0_9CORY|nr:hypothetical protein [Candidatus Corynebacterium gallistercoris]